MKAMVLVLDDEPNIRRDLLKHLQKSGYDVCTAGTIEEANKIAQVEDIDFAIIDLVIDYSSEYGGIRVIENINKWRPSAKIVVLSAYELTPEVQRHLDRVHYDSFVSKGVSGNYIKAVIEELRVLEEAPPKKTCFVLMPFSDTPSCKKEQWTEIFETMIRQAVEGGGYSYDCFRACLDIGNVIKDILLNINRADVVIADLTDRNPNVFYELGVRHALRNATILITQKIEHVPFDLRHLALVEYDWTTRKGRDEFATTIRRALAVIENTPDNETIVSPVRDVLNLETKA